MALARFAVLTLILSAAPACSGAKDTPADVPSDLRADAQTVDLTTDAGDPDANAPRDTLDLRTPDLRDAPGELVVDVAADADSSDLTDAVEDVALDTAVDLAPEVTIPDPLPPYEPTAYVGTDGIHFRDSAGRLLLLHGANVSNVSKHAPFFPQWMTEQHVQDLADRGLNVVRFLVIWEAIEPEEGVFDSTYLDMVEEKIAWFTSRGIYVVVDMHQDTWGPKFGGDGAPLWATLDHGKEFDPPPGDWFLKYGEPAVKQAFQSFWDNEEGIRDHFVQAWQEVAKRFADDPMVIGYDIINEPYIGNWDVMDIPQFEAEVLTPFYAVVAAGIREHDPNHMIFVEPTASKGLGIKGGLGPIGDAKVAYAAHYYHPTMDMLQTYSDTKENMLEVFQQIRDEGHAIGGPTFLGEFGFYAGFEGDALYAQHQIEVMEELGISWTVWSVDKCNNGFCLLDNEGAPIWTMDYITQAWPRRVAGRLDQWHYDPVSHALTLTFDPDGYTGDAPTRLYAPPMWYPDGATLTCEGPDDFSCPATADSGIITIPATHTPGPHTITLHPATP